MKIAGTASYVAGSLDETGTAALEALGDAQSRVVLYLSGVQIQQIQSGQRSATVAPDGQQQLQPLQNSLSPAPWFFPALLVQGLVQDASYSVTDLGTEALDGAQVYHIHATRAPQGQGDAGTMSLLTGLSAFELYVDAGSYLPVALAFATHPSDDALVDIPVKVEYSGYSNGGGLATPLAVKKFLQRTVLLSLSITSVVVNSGVSPADFQIQ